MKTIRLIALLAPLVVAISPPDYLTMIFPDPNLRYPINTSFTFGFVDFNQQYIGLIANVVMSFQRPGGNKELGLAAGTPITNRSELSLDKGGLLTNGHFTAENCRTSINSIMKGYLVGNQTGNYTFFWDLIYVESADPSQANSSYCGPPPFSAQTWSSNVTVAVVERDPTLPSGVSAIPRTTTSPLPSKPTGQVISFSGALRMKDSAVHWCLVITLIGLVLSFC